MDIRTLKNLFKEDAEKALNGDSRIDKDFVIGALEIINELESLPKPVTINVFKNHYFRLDRAYDKYENSRFKVRSALLNTHNILIVDFISEKSIAVMYCYERP